MNQKILLWVLLALAACAPTEEATTVGFIGPFSGDPAVYGESMDLVVALAVEEINSNGMALVFQKEDGQCTAKGAATAAQKLINVDGVKVLYVLCSPEVLGAAPITEANEAILFSPFAGNPDITAAGDFVFRNFPSDATSGSKVAMQAYSDGHTEIATLAEQNDYSQAVKRVFIETFEGEIVTEEDYLAESTDFRTELLKIKESGATALYFAPLQPSTMGRVLTQMQELGMDIPLYTNELAGSADTLAEYGELLEGAIFAEPGFDAEAPLAKELLDKLRARYGEIPRILPDVYFAFAYDGVYILADAIKACGEDTTCIQQYLYDIKDRPGTAGMLTMDENGDPVLEYVMKQVQDGVVVTI
tara:strand:- start:250 stop:1329 length:1080 start_codon:yes stop_codon:yes gene_type:complete